MQLLCGLRERFRQFSEDIMHNKSLLYEIENSNFDIAMVDGIPTTRFYYMASFSMISIYALLNALTLF